MASSGKLVTGCCCCYSAWDCSDCVCGCTDSVECCCLVSDSCLSINCKENLGCGMVTNEDNNECCKIGCCFCRVGCKSPESLCAQASQFLFIKQAAAFPFNDRFLPECVMACCCLACAPECGCCVEAPECKALHEDPVLKAMKMER